MSEWSVFETARERDQIRSETNGFYLKLRHVLGCPVQITIITPLYRIKFGFKLSCDPMRLFIE